MNLLLLMCTLEVRKVDTQHAVIGYVEPHKNKRTADELWIDQCIAKKAMWM